MAVVFPTNWSFVAVVVVVVSIATEQVGHSVEPMSARQRAAQILDATGVRGGLVVHLGCGDGKLTTELRMGKGFVVHGLDTDPENVEKAREHIRSLGLYGNVSVDTFDGKHLPYVANLVNLVLAEDLGEVSMDEVMRVLAPRGVAYVGGKKIVKPWPKEIDEWTHFLHGADNNAVAKDAVVGPPKRYQWIAGPRWPRTGRLREWLVLRWCCCFRRWCEWVRASGWLPASGTRRCVVGRVLLSSALLAVQIHI